MERLCQHREHCRKKCWWTNRWISRRYHRLEMVIYCNLQAASSYHNSDILLRSFYFQSPLAIVAILLVCWKFDSPEPSLSGYTPVSTKRKLRRVDILGSLTLAIAITGFLLALDLGAQKIRWTHPIIWILLSLSVVVGITFLLVEAYVAQEPIFPLRLLIHRDVVVGYLITALQSCAQFGVHCSASVLRSGISR